MAHTLDNFYRFDPTIELVVVLPASQQAYWKALCQEFHIDIPHRIASGGETRFTRCATGWPCSPTRGSWPFTTECARWSPTPLSSVASLRHKSMAVPYLPLPLTDSLRQLGPDGSSQAVDRSRFVAVQTPQTFRCHEIKEAYDQPYRETFTDDASVYEAAGYAPRLVEGNRENLKITLPIDLALAEILLAR